ncbi:unnamed protein product [Cochlearia groenlandica]
MANRATCKLESSSNKNKCRLGSKKDQTFLDIPYDLLRLVILRLPLRDNIRASAVCKTWHEACLSVRVVDSSPWLIYFSKTKESYELYDPSMEKTYNLDFRFSAIVDMNSIVLKTCLPNAKEWNTLVFTNLLPKKANTFLQIVFSNGLFHCLTNTGCLLILDPSLDYRKVVPGVTRRHHESNYGFFMTEHQGGIFLIYMYNNLRPTVFKLDRTRFEWTERTSLGGLMMYLSPLSSETRAEQKQPSGIRDCLCLSVFHGFKRTCIYYKVDEDNMVALKWRKYDPYANIWIMPPLNLLDLPLCNQIL